MDTTSIVDLSGLLNYVLEVLGVVLMALAGYATAWLAKKLKLSADSEVRAYLNNAVENAVRFVIDAARAKGQDISKIDVRNAAVAEAATILLDRVPDALKRFGFSPEALAKKVISELANQAPLPPPEEKTS